MGNRIIGMQKYTVTSFRVQATNLGHISDAERMLTREDASKKLAIAAANGRHNSVRRLVQHHDADVNFVCKVRRLFYFRFLINICPKRNEARAKKILWSRQSGR